MVGELSDGDAADAAANDEAQRRERLTLFDRGLFGAPYDGDARAGGGTRIALLLALELGEVNERSLTPLVASQPQIIPFAWAVQTAVRSADRLLAASGSRINNRCFLLRTCRSFLIHHFAVFPLASLSTHLRPITSSPT